MFESNVEFILYSLYYESVIMQNEPYVKESSCSYCGDAPINHVTSFFESAIAITLDIHAKKIIKYTPFFIKDFVDLVPEFLFRTLAFLKLVKFGEDISKANSFRSKIIWKEAKERGIKMEQVIFMGRPLDQYRALLKIKNKKKFFYFESIPINPEFGYVEQSWDDKIVMKQEFEKHSIPIPSYFGLSFLSSLSSKKIENKFSKINKPLIVKPRVGSRGRHTVTGINSLQQLRDGIKISSQICFYLSVEEHLKGSVCRATLVNGILAGFYKGQAPILVGDGEKTIKELIEDVDKKRKSRVEPIRISKELHDHISRSGFRIHDVLPVGVSLSLTHRIGRLFGGRTVEMVDDLHPSFIPIFQKAAKVVGIPVVGFDAIIPDPTKPADSQRWGIIECNSLPFIDLHYYALEGKPRNIAGMIWDLW